MAVLRIQVSAGNREKRMDRKYLTLKSGMVPVDLAWTMRWVVVIVTKGKKAEGKKGGINECIPLGQVKVKETVI